MPAADGVFHNHHDATQTLKPSVGWDKSFAAQSPLASSAGFPMFATTTCKSSAEIMIAMLVIAFCDHDSQNLYADCH